ncbi:MAG: hypothetical protein AAFN27_17135 [Pseudomonadota bacterium]
MKSAGAFFPYLKPVIVCHILRAIERNSDPHLGMKREYMTEITGWDDLEAWLTARPPEDFRSIAARISLRALPGLAEVADKTGDWDLIALEVFRANQLANTIALQPQRYTEELRSVAKSVLQDFSEIETESARFWFNARHDSTAKGADVAARAAILAMDNTLASPVDSLKALANGALTYPAPN